METLRIPLKPFYALIAATLFLVAFIACQTDEATVSGVGSRAGAEMKAPDGTIIGMVNMVQGPNGVLVSVEATGLVPGGHGFHIHEVGSCSPDFSAAGDHFDLGDRAHGYLFVDGDHLGDMPNIYADDDGTARADVFNDVITLDTGPANSVFDDDGSAIIIHEKGDTYGEDAGAGGRVACGVIVPG